MVERKSKLILKKFVKNGTKNLGEINLLKLHSMIQPMRKHNSSVHEPATRLCHEHTCSYQNPNFGYSIHHYSIVSFVSSYGISHGRHSCAKKKVSACLTFAPKGKERALRFSNWEEMWIITGCFLSFLCQ